VHNHSITTVYDDGTQLSMQCTSTEDNADQRTAVHLKDRQRDAQRTDLGILHYVVTFNHEVHVLIQD